MDEQIYIRKIGLINGITPYITLPKTFGKKGDQVEVQFISDDELKIMMRNRIID